MDKNMICIENPSQYNNQLLFNLDASDSSNYGNMNRNPGVIVIEKIEQKPKALSVKQSSNQVPLTNERLALAIKLAKLDVSNSQYEEQSHRNRTKYAPKHSKPGRPRINNKYVSEKEVMLPPKSPFKSKKSRQSQVKVTKHPVKIPKTPKKIQFKEPPTFEDHIRGIVQGTGHNRSRNIKNIRQKDVCTSTADLDHQLASYTDQSDFKQFSERLQNVVKKEKLRKRHNDRAPHKSGFLSLQRSPSKSHKKSSHHRSSPLFTSKQYQFHPKKAAGYKAVHPMRSPPTKLLKTKHKSPLKKLEYSDIATSEDEIMSKIPNKDRRLEQTKTPPWKILQKPLKGVEARNSTSQGVVDSIFDDIVEDTADKMHKMHTSFDLEDRAHEMNNTGTFQTLHQRINDIEIEENEIRARWKNIEYDDITKPPKTSKPQARSYTSNPSSISITVHDQAVPRKSRIKEPYKFVSDKKLSRPSPLSSCGVKLVSCKSQSRTKLCMKDESVQSILQYKRERKHFLQKSFHEPKGHFDPWKIVQELSNEIMSSVMASVCNEVNEMCETCVDQIFEGEFAAPNQSNLLSLVDQSSNLSQCDESAVLHDDHHRHSVSFR